MFACRPHKPHTLNMMCYGYALLRLACVLLGCVGAACACLRSVDFLQRREDAALMRLERQEMLREAEIKVRSEVREHRIKSAVVAAKAVEERRQRRARRKIIKKFLKSAALQMTSLEDVEKEAEMKVLREAKRRDFVARAEMKHEFKIAQIQDRIREKEERVRQQEAARRDAEAKARRQAQQEQLARQQLLKVDVAAAMRVKPGKDVISSLSTFMSPIRGVGKVREGTQEVVLLSSPAVATALMSLPRTVPLLRHITHVFRVLVGVVIVAHDAAVLCSVTRRCRRR